VRISGVEVKTKGIRGPSESTNRLCATTRRADRAYLKGVRHIKNSKSDLCLSGRGVGNKGQCSKTEEENSTIRIVKSDSKVLGGT